MVTFKDIEEAYQILKPVVKKTPLERSKTFSNLLKTNVYLKQENLQTTGSFKIRGAYNKIYHLTEKEKKQGVVCASAGNHAQGVALASTLMKVKSTVYMPIYTSPAKVIATKSYGAQVVLEGATYDDAAHAAKKYAEEKKLTFVHAFNDEYVIAGQGTIGLEIYHDLPAVEAVIIPIGGGGLISGVALALKTLKPKIKIIGVEAEGAQSMKLSLEQHKIVPLKSIMTIADGIAVKTPKDLTFALAQQYIDQVVTVNDEEIANTLYLLLQRTKLVVEPAGAVGLAALLSKKISYPKKNVVALLSGGNVNLPLLTQIIERGMMRHKLLVKVSITALDKPRVLKDILTILGNVGANVVSIEHDRITASVPVGYVKLIITFQTLGKEQIDMIKEKFDSKKVHYHLLS
ncbi:MAG: threonine ammonia-lyase [Candidatus Thermoplasmatota archaeon]|jgi:threonine dehydratase|nr:threonine ammonia-lyase [Candidatus Thermoplasmatota archaeon]